jgi:CheY-like chemotaxis protein
VDRTRGPLELLLVEDNSADVRLVREAVAEYRLPVRLTLASDGEEAVKILTSDFRPARIILDINLPKLSGLAVLEQYKGQRSPVVVFSSGCTEAEIFLAVKLGARECVLIPKNIEAYMQTVRDMIERWALSDTAEKT